MGGSARRINIEKAVALGDDLIAVLNMKRESDSLMHCLEGAETLRCSWEAECHEVQSSIEGLVRPLLLVTSAYPFTILIVIILYIEFK